MQRFRSNHGSLAIILALTLVVLVTMIAGAWALMNSQQGRNINRGVDVRVSRDNTRFAVELMNDLVYTHILNGYSAVPLGNIAPPYTTTFWAATPTTGWGGPPPPASPPPLWTFTNGYPLSAGMPPNLTASATVSVCDTELLTITDLILTYTPNNPIYPTACGPGGRFLVQVPLQLSDASDPGLTPPPPPASSQYVEFVSTVQLPPHTVAY